MENLPQTVGKNLQTLRKSKGMTQQELAKQVNYSDKSISKWELGYALPSVDILLDFASYYGVSLDFLVTEHQEEEIKKTTEIQPKLDPNRPTIMALTITVIILVAVCIFFSRYLFHDEGEDATALWPVFVWMVPVAFALLAAETHLFYHNSIGTIVLSSCFLWTLLAAFPIVMRRSDLCLLLVVGIPIQIIVLLMRNLKKKKDN